MNIVLCKQNMSNPSVQTYVHTLAEHGKLDILKTMDFKYLDEWTMCKAAMYGHIHVVEWLHTQGVRPNQWVTAYASINGHTDLLKLLHQLQFPWDEHCAVFATMNGHYDTLVWLYEHGCPMRLDHILYTAKTYFRPVPKNVINNKTKAFRDIVVHYVRYLGGTNIKSTYQMIVDWVHMVQSRDTVQPTQNVY